MRLLAPFSPATNGPPQDQLRAQVASGPCPEKVQFTGYVTPSFLAFDRADIVLAPSLREPFGNAVVEAQLSERPVVAAAAGGHLESVQHGESGFLVPPENPEAMADAVQELLLDPNLGRRIALSARRSARERFDVFRYRAEIVRVIQQAVADKVDCAPDDIVDSSSSSARPVRAEKSLFGRRMFSQKDNGSRGVRDLLRALRLQ